MAGGNPSPLKILAVKNGLLIIIFRQEMQTLKLKNCYFEEFTIKMEILSTYDLAVENLQQSVGILCLIFST